jgi:nucleoside-diphosphate-sugar epimerase
LSWGEYHRHIVEASGRDAVEFNVPELILDAAVALGEFATKLDHKPRLCNRQRAVMGRQLVWSCRHDRARAHFGYHPQVDIATGVQRAFEWYCEQGWISKPRESRRRRSSDRHVV